MGGRGRCAGLGSITACVSTWPSQRPLTSSSVHSRVMISRSRATRFPRSLNGTAQASNSRSYHPPATPRMRRPLEIWSTLASTLASTTGLRSGRTSTPVPSRRRSVRIATAVSVDNASRNGNGRRAPSKMWSHAHADAYPSASARDAYARISSIRGSSGAWAKFLSATPISTRDTAMLPPLVCPRALRQGAKHALRGDGQFERPRAGGVGDRAGDGRERRPRRGLADAARTERPAALSRLDGDGLDVGKVRGHRHEVVCEQRREVDAGLEGDLLAERLADAHRGAPLDLSGDALRVDRPAHVVARDVLEQPRRPGLDVHLDFRGVASIRVVGERPPLPGFEVRGRGPLTLERGQARHGHAAPGALRDDAGQRHAPVGG